MVYVIREVFQDAERDVLDVEIVARIVERAERLRQKRHDDLAATTKMRQRKQKTNKKHHYFEKKKHLHDYVVVSLETAKDKGEK